MKEIIVISGKGGTGKTTVTAALSRIVENKVLVDTDVDASNLELLTAPQNTESEVFIDGLCGLINPEICINCHACMDACRFDAIVQKEDFCEVEEDFCEGCTVCGLVCPVDAITFEEGETGEIKFSETEYGYLYHGALSVGRDNSGKMVSKIRTMGRDKAKELGVDYLLIDGAPGIGCQVISSLTGTDYAIAVTEPSLSAFHDLKRIITLTDHFRIPVGIVINKFDINIEISKKLSDWAQDNNIPILEKIPLNIKVIEAMTCLKSPMEIEDPALQRLYNNIWINTLSYIK